MTNLKAVFFDMYGTLAGFDPPREEIQAQAVEKFGLDVTKEGIDAGYHLADEFMTSQNSQKPVRTMNANEQWAFFARFEQLVLQATKRYTEPPMNLSATLRSQKSVQYIRIPS